MFFKLKSISKLMSSGWVLLTVMESKHFIAVGVFPVELFAYKVSMVSAVS